MKVEELSTFGKAFNYLPLKAQLVQTKVMFSELIKKFGLFGAIGFMLKVSKKQKQLKNYHDKNIKEKFPDLSPSANKELFMMGAMY